MNVSNIHVNPDECIDLVVVVEHLFALFQYFFPLVDGFQGNGVDLGQKVLDQFVNSIASSLIKGGKRG